MRVEASQLTRSRPAFWLKLESLQCTTAHQGPLTIRQGVGSEIAVQPGPDRTVEIGGRCALVEVRDYVGQALG